MVSIRFGLSATLTGKFGLQGADSLNGLLLWSDYQNSLGGIYVKEIGETLPVELVYFDDGSDPGKAIEITENLISEEKVDILLGPYSSSLSLVSAEVAKNYGRVLWNYGGSTDEIFTGEYHNVISSITPASRYFNPFLDYITERNSNGLKAAIVYAEDSGFSRQVAWGAMNYSDKLGIKFESLPYYSGSDTFSSVTSGLKDRNIRFVLGVGRFDDDLKLAGYLSGFTSCLIGAGIHEFQKVLGNKADGFYSVSQWEPAVNTIPDFGIDSATFSKLYEDRFNKIPDYTAAQSFNMGMIISHFIKTVGTLDEKRLREEILNSRFSTFYGDFEIERTSNIQTGHKTIVTQWQIGKKEIIYPPVIQHHN